MSYSDDLRSGRGKEGDCYYRIFNGKAEIEHFNSEYCGTVCIPGTLGGCPVTSLGDHAFLNCVSLTSVTIPASVTGLAVSVFEGCSSLSTINVDLKNDIFASLDGVLFDKNITTLLRCPENRTGCYKVPNSVTTIWDSAFFMCISLTSVMIGSRVTRIGESDTFSGCSNLTAIDVDKDNIFYSSVDGILFNKNQTKLLTCPLGKTGSYTSPDSVIHIGDLAFMNCSHLTSVTIGSHVFQIGNYAFAGCTSLKCANISNQVCHIGEDVFQECVGLLAINVDSRNSVFSSVNGVLFDKRQTKLIRFPAGKGRSYVVPQGVTCIEDSAFMSCSELKTVVLASTIAHVGELAFSNCSGLSGLFIYADIPVECREKYVSNLGLNREMKVYFIKKGSPVVRYV